MLLLLGCTPDPAIRTMTLPEGSRPPLEGEVEQLPGETGEQPEPVYDHLPVFRVSSPPIGDGTKVAATLEVIRDHDGTLADLDTAPLDAVWPIGIEIHGSSSAGGPKYGYRFECRDDAGEDTACALLDLPADSDWVLHAPYSDKTLIRNALAYTLGRDVNGDTRWSPRSRHLELFLNGAYQGVYLLVERISRDGDRLDITPESELDVSGGYIVRIDQHRDEGWNTARGTPIDWYYPKNSAITDAQRGYLVSWFDQFEAVLGQGDWTTQYPNWMDVDSWIDAWLLNELANNIDAYRLSAYHYKDSDTVDGRLRAGPIWDFDRAWGNVNYCDTWNTYGWIYDELATCGYAYEFPFWWEQLEQDPVYLDQRRCRWEELRAGVLSDAALQGTFDALLAEVAEAEPRDHATWATIGVAVDPNYYVGASYGDEVAWLRAWMAARVSWMDTNLAGVCP